MTHPRPTGPAQAHHPPPAWGCLADDVPEVPRGDNHTQGYVDGAVAPLTGRPHDHLSPTLGIQGFARFLRRYARDHRWLVLQDRAAQPQGGPLPLSCGLRQGGFGSHPHPLRLRSGTRRSGVGFVNLA